MKDILVIGQLGELGKKIVELESSLHNAPNDIAGLQLAAYHSVLEAWPVEDAQRAVLLLSILRINVAKYQSADADLRNALSSESLLLLISACVQYLQIKDELRSNIVELNLVGKLIGNVPTLQINMETQNES